MSVEDFKKALHGGEKLKEFLLEYSRLLHMVAPVSLQASGVQYEQYTRSSGLALGSKWALLIPTANGRHYCLLQARDLPLASDLRNALEKTDIKSPIKVLRDFLKQHPDNLDARMQLLDCLKIIAESRTQHLLKLDAEPGTGLDTAELVINSILGVVASDANVLDGPELGPEQDVLIWGDYAHELDYLFRSGDWRLVTMPQVYSKHPPFEALSHTMAQIYRRHISKIEAFLEEYPKDRNLWQYYFRMASIAKHGSTKAIVERITPSPEMLWPLPEVLNVLIAEAMEKRDWDCIIEALFYDWPNTYRSLFNIHFDGPEDLMIPVAKALLETHWRERIKPLLESLIRTNRIEDAETVISDVAKNS